ncbi:S-protein homolog 1-like [Momordica charantia]|uniref:S-protein homolog n=1 Tax=Momordica charantia TaxID=3673 RepID=A0A6J1CQI8_MOMCH|nr:S-protein homolog 1-like [Momordica charantia]
MGPIYPTNRFVAVLLLVSAALVGAQTKPSGSPSLLVTQRWHVHVVNNLNNNFLDVHCKSKDDDLGYQRLVRGADFQWSFKVNFWGTTLFWCNLHKPGAYVTFEVFWPESRNAWLRNRCHNGTEGHCIWTAKDDGIYLRNIPTNSEELIHKWISLK